MLFRQYRVIYLYLVFAGINLYLQGVYGILNTHFLLTIKNVMFSMTSNDTFSRDRINVK
jgi:hypothetical protein